MAVKRPSRRREGNGWRRLQQISQLLSLAAFLLLVIVLPRPWPAWLRQLPMQLDPLTGIVQAIASRQMVTGTLLGLGVLEAVLLLNLAATRFWCRYLCPLGALLGVLARLALVQRRVGEDCKNCGVCEYKCPVEGAAAIRVYAVAGEVQGSGERLPSPRGERRRRNQQ